MSGHSKWHKIQHKKGAADVRRGKIFTRHAKLIAIAARSGDDPDMNPGLKTAIANAKADNVPNDNIKRAIQKGAGTGKDAVTYQECIYEGYAQNGVAIVIECLTDNINRTNTNVRAVVGKNGGNLGTQGSVSYMFKEKGSIDLVTEGKDQEEVELDIIDSGAEDYEFEDGTAFITTALADLGKVRDFLTEKGYRLENVKKTRIPDTEVQITDLGTAQKILKLIEAIEEDDDVNEVFHNADIDDSILSQL